MERFDVVALGELLVDFTQNGFSDQGNPIYEANPGGAPANVLAMLRKLGKTCAFIGKVGQDSFGNQLEQTLRQLGIDTRALSRDERVPTTLAVVSTLAGGERAFSFYRSPGADIRLTSGELDLALLRNCRIFHFGSLSLTDEPCRSATVAAIRQARQAGALISFDPNLREPLWRSLEDAKAQIRWGLAQCDILKIADNELEFITGETDFDRGAAALQRDFPNLILLNVTTGAGDTFCACVLHFVLEHGLEGLTQADLQEMLRFANAAAYLVTTKKGAICSMPERAQIEALLH